MDEQFGDETFRHGLKTAKHFHPGMDKRPIAPLHPSWHTSMDHRDMGTTTSLHARQLVYTGPYKPTANHALWSAPDGTMGEKIYKGHYDVRTNQRPRHTAPPPPKQFGRYEESKDMTMDSLLREMYGIDRD